MQYTTLGATGLKISVAGLGYGGNSRIGLGTGKSEAESMELVRAALDLGVTYFDTAALYGTEPILGRAIKPDERAKVVISTKAHIHQGDPARHASSTGRRCRGEHEPGVDVMPFGTSSIAHLQSNVASILRPPLPSANVTKLGELFGHLVGVGLDLPDYIKAQS